MQRGCETANRPSLENSNNLSVSRNEPDLHRHRYPEVPLEEIRARISRFQQVLGDSKELKVEQISKQFFRIRP
jgi:hypothetical protein